MEVKILPKFTVFRLAVMLSKKPISHLFILKLVDIALLTRWFVVSIPKADVFLITGVMVLLIPFIQRL